MVEADGHVRQVSNDTLTQIYSSLSSDGSQILCTRDDTARGSLSV